MFEDSLLIVAHPDDEVLWLSSVVARVERIVFCFSEDPGTPGMGAARRKVIDEYPFQNVTSLDIEEPQSFNKANWDDPEITDYGIKLSKCGRSDARYKATYGDLVSRARELVADRKNVFTHNPWGEYGHEDHILVYRVLSALQQEFHFNLWFSNYCSNHSASLMDNYISGFHSDYQCLTVDRELAEKIADVYRKNGCWTWYEDYQWFDSECLMKSVLSTDQDQALLYGHISPLNYIKIFIGPQRPQQNLLARVGSRLKGAFKNNS
jgi:LmbE family N-acetylglucosaminyl deacetylase